MKLRCSVCGCFVGSNPWIMGWDNNAQCWVEPGVAAYVQPCKRCLHALKEPVYIKAFLEGFIDGTFGKFFWWPVKHK